MWREAAVSRAVENVSGCSPNTMGAGEMWTEGHGVQTIGAVFNHDKENGALIKILLIHFRCFKRGCYNFLGSVPFGVSSLIQVV